LNGRIQAQAQQADGTLLLWKTAIEELKAISSNAEVISILEDGLKKYETFGQFSQYFVSEIFKEHGLVVLDGDDARLKKKFSEIIKEEVLNSRAIEVLKSNVGVS
jgi:uncharacterized protein YllA (UPF0747 family)